MVLFTDSFDWLIYQKTLAIYYMPMEGKVKRDYEVQSKGCTIADISQSTEKFPPYPICGKWSTRCYGGYKNIIKQGMHNWMKKNFSKCSENIN